LSYGRKLNDVQAPACFYADDYEKMKYEIRTKETLARLTVGDIVDVKFAMDVEISNGKVVKFENNGIDISVKGRTLSEPVSNIIYIKLKKRKI